MKRLLFLSVFLIASCACFSQGLQQLPGYGQKATRFRALDFLGIPVIDTVCNLVVNGTNGDCTGAIVYRLADSTMYIKRPDKWTKIGSSGEPIDSNTWIKNFVGGGAQAASFYISGIGATNGSYRINLPAQSAGGVLESYHPTYQVDYTDATTGNAFGLNMQPSYDISGIAGIDFYIQQNGTGYTKSVRFTQDGISTGIGEFVGSVTADEGFFVNGMVAGGSTFTGQVNGVAATTGGRFPILSQITDSLNARFSSIPAASLNAVTTVGNISGNRINITGQNGTGKTGLSLSNTGSTATVESWNAGTASAGTLLLNPSGGNVGVGMTPTAKFSVNGVINAANRIESTDGTVSAVMSFGAGTGIWGTFSNHPALFYTNSSEKLRITTAGNVGINTTSPDYKLQINSGHLFLTGGTSPPSIGSGLAAWIGAGSTGVIRSRDFTAGTDNDIALVGDDALVQGATSVQLTAPITMVSNDLTANGYSRAVNYFRLDKGLQTIPAFSTYTPMYEMQYQDISTGDTYGFNIQAEDQGGSAGLSVYLTDPTFGSQKVFSMVGPNISSGSLSLTSNINAKGMNNNGQVTEHTRTVSTAATVNISQDDFIIFLSGMGTGTGTGVAINLPNPAFTEGRKLVFIENSASSWTPNYSIQRTNNPPLSAISGTMTIQAVGGSWRLISSY